MTDSTSGVASARPVAAVTGSRQGIGRGIALALAARGYDLVLIDIAEDDTARRTLQELSALGARAAFIAADIARAEDADALARQAFDAFGNIHCLVNNAGVQALNKSADVLDTTLESFDRVLGINLRGTFFVTQAFARRMVKQGAQDAHLRSIITISSINAEQARTKTPEYCISKSGLSMLNKIFAVRLAREGIACFEVLPGLVETDMTAGRRGMLDKLVEGGLSPISRWGQPRDIGEAVASLAGGAIPFCTGEALHIDGGMHIPRSALEPAYMRPLLEG
ncbi:MAG: 3-ketoacyl-ACP reductase [Pseudomonadota bacterium]